MSFIYAKKVPQILSLLIFVLVVAGNRVNAEAKNNDIILTKRDNDSANQTQIDVSLKSMESVFDLELTDGLEINKEQTINKNKKLIKKIEVDKSKVHFYIQDNKSNNDLHLYLDKKESSKSDTVRAFLNNGKSSNVIDIPSDHSNSNKSEMNLQSMGTGYGIANIDSEKVENPKNLKGFISQMPIWKNLEGLTVTPDKSFKFIYTPQTKVSQLKNVTRDGDRVTIKPTNNNDEISFMLDHVGSYGPVDVSVKVTVLSIKNTVSLDISKSGFMRWRLSGASDIEYRYDFYDQKNNSIKVSGYHYFEGVNSAKILGVGKDEVENVFSSSTTQVKYDDSEKDYYNFSSEVGGWSDNLTMGYIYSNTDHLNLKMHNNDNTESAVAYSKKTLTESAFTNITEHEKWLKSGTTTIPKENYFTFLYNNGIEVEPLSGNTDIKESNGGYNVNFSGNGQILIKHIGYYEGRWLSIKVTSDMKSEKDGDLNSTLQINEEYFMRWALKSQMTNNIEYEFVDEDLKPVQVSGYITLSRLNKAKNIGVDRTTIKNVYSTTPSEIGYWNFGDTLYLKSSTSGQGIEHKMTFTYDKAFKLNYFVENNDEDESAVDYTQNTDSVVGIPDPKASSLEYDEIKEDKQLVNSINQIIPYEPTIGKQSFFSWKIDLKDEENINFDKLTITDEVGKEVNDLFEVTKEENQIEIQVKPDISVTDSFYSHLYQFNVSYKINYDKSIQGESLDEKGYLSKRYPVSFVMDGLQPVDTILETKFNFNSNTTIIYKDLDSNILLQKNHKSYITQKDNLTEEFINNVKIPQYEYVNSNEELSNYQSKYTSNVTSINYRKINNPILSIDGNPEEVIVNSDDKKLQLSGSIILDSDSKYEIHMKYGGNDEIIAHGNGVKDKISWEVDDNYRVKILEVGKNIPVEIYAKEMSGLESAHINLKLYFAGNLSFTQVPEVIDFGKAKLPKEITEVNNKKPYQIKVNDLRGKNSQYKLYLNVKTPLNGFTKEYKDGLFFIDKNNEKLPLTVGNAILVDEASTGNDNSKQETIFNFPLGQGIQLHSYPDMKIGEYGAAIEWSIVDAP